jgi:glutamate/tyrosine decarboxylase-like PLP-dependent enzyme
MVMDALVLQVEPGEDGVMRGEDLDAAISEYERLHPTHKIFAVVATAGSTNLGVIDDLDGCGRVANRRDIWFHVDGAYGLAALCAPSVRPKFNGIERADSLIVDPHKWLFAPFDACALIYREPHLAKKVHLQHAEYLETLR